MAKRLKDLPIGTLVKDLDTKFNGKIITWMLTEINDDVSGNKRLFLLSEKVLLEREFEAKEIVDYYAQKYIKPSEFKGSKLEKWLNAKGQTWFEKDEHYYGSSEIEWNNEPGFLTNFGDSFFKKLVKTNNNKIVQIPSKDDITSSFFNTKQRRRALNTSGTYTEYFTRTNAPIYYNENNYTPNIYTVDERGSINFGYGVSRLGIRPCIVAKNDILVSDSPDSHGVYTIVWNQPPTKPSSIEIPTKIVAMQNLNISWSRASDPDNDSITYILERKLNSNNYTQIYSGGSIKYTDRINKGYSKVKYRVKARDSVGNESDWIYSVERNIINNSTPTISSETAENLGTKTNGFTIDYTVDDEDDNQTLRVYEYLDDLELKSFTATKKKTNTISISEDSFIKILNGNHKIKIKVVDSEGAFAEKTFTFTKNETQIHLELKTPLQADDVITKATLTVNRSIPSGAVFKVEICNNGFDTSPTWQDVTKQVIENKKIFISNKKKTTSKWGLNIRITVNRNGASGDCFINGLGGAFE